MVAAALLLLVSTLYLLFLPSYLVRLVAAKPQARLTLRDGVP